MKKITSPLVRAYIDAEATVHRLITRDAPLYFTMDGLRYAGWRVRGFIQITPAPVLRP